MRVHYVLKRYPRLSETFVVREILGIEALGVEVAIDALLPPADEPRHDAVASVRADVRYLPRVPRRSTELGAWLRLAARRPARLTHFWFATIRKKRAGQRKAWQQAHHVVLVADRARQERATHLHAHFATGAAEVAVPAGKLLGIPVTITAHAKDIYHDANSELLPERVRGASAVVTVSAYNLAHLISRLGGSPLGVASPPVRHVPNGVDLGPINTSGVGTKSGPVLCVSRLVAKKGIDTLIEAIALVAPEDRELTLDIVGGGPLEEDLRALATRIGVADRVTFHGPQPSSVVEAAYARCSLVAMACRVDQDGDRDGLPTVLVEALARSIPVISTDVVGIPELVRHGTTGLLVESDDAEALAAAIRKIRADPHLAKDLGHEGRTLVSRCYDPATSARALVGVWDEVSA